MPESFIGPVPPDALHVMSFNLRGPEDEPPHSWDDRRPVVLDILEREQPDLVGTQEGRFRHVHDLADALHGRYDWIGLGRNGGGKGEYTAVYYNRERLRPLAYDHVWLSTVPKLIGSRTWGNWQHPRMLTWAAFEDLGTGRQFAFVNTHLDHRSAFARRRSAHLIRRLVGRRFKVKRWPVLLTGDFNDSAGTAEAFRILTKRGLFRDTWDDAAERVGEGARTFHGYRGVEMGERIDWILASRRWETLKAGVNTYTGIGGVEPSDHWPVQAVVRLGH